MACVTEDTEPIFKLGKNMWNLGYFLMGTGWVRFPINKMTGMTDL